MGLDVSAWRQLTKIEEAEWQAEIEQATSQFGALRISESRHFIGRTKPLADGFYKGERLRFGPYWSFVGRSYSRYGEWREWLAKTFGYPPTGDDAQHLHSAGAWEAKEGPFRELINFYDNEGQIGTAACFKLARDFQAGQATAQAAAITANDPELYELLYRDFWKACEWATDGGCLEFH